MKMLAAPYGGYVHPRDVVLGAGCRIIEDRTRIQVKHRGWREWGFSGPDYDEVLTRAAEAILREGLPPKN